MCLGTIGRVTVLGPEQCVEIRAANRVITGSLLAVGDAVGLGDWVVVHSGLVLARLTEEEARDALEVRQPTGEGAHEREPM